LIHTLLVYFASHPRAGFNGKLEAGTGCTSVITFAALVFHSHRISSWIRFFRREWRPLSTNSNAALQPDSKRKSFRLVSWGDARGIRPHESSHSFAYPIRLSHVPTITARHLRYQITSRRAYRWTTCRPGAVGQTSGPNRLLDTCGYLFCKRSWRS